MARIQGTLGFTADKQQVTFLANDGDSGSEQQFPWDKLAEDRRLLAFIRDFRLQRHDAGKAHFQYAVDCESSELNAWFNRNVTWLHAPSKKSLSLGA